LQPIAVIEQTAQPEHHSVGGVRPGLAMIRVFWAGAGVAHRQERPLPSVIAELYPDQAARGGEQLPTLHERLEHCPASSLSYVNGTGAGSSFLGGPCIQG
jgi:hypothetical protein